MNEKRLKEIEIRLNAASYGEWEIYDPEADTGTVGCGLEIWAPIPPEDELFWTDASLQVAQLCELIDPEAEEYSEPGEVQWANARFIVHAKRDVMDLLSEVRRLRLALDTRTAYEKT